MAPLFQQAAIGEITEPKRIGFREILPIDLELADCLREILLLLRMHSQRHHRVGDIVGCLRHYIVPHRIHQWLVMLDKSFFGKRQRWMPRINRRQERKRPA